ncbi:gas vesicle protein [Alkalibacillus flavidus]|uniref:Gas vesicle protein n=1 Tax=Alkalibacillus flavidus TaxID=546021 RepID=A0ABV2KU83_9BACI
MRLWQKGLVIGALSGFVLSLIQRDERQHVLGQSKRAAGQVKHIYQNPSESVRQLRLKLNDVMTNVDQFVQQLDQVQQKLDQKTDDKNSQ